MKEKYLKKSFYLLILIISALVLFQLKFDYLNAQDDNPDDDSDEACVDDEDDEDEPSFRTYDGASGNGNERTLRFQGKGKVKCARRGKHCGKMVLGESKGAYIDYSCPKGQECLGYLLPEREPGEEQRPGFDYACSEINGIKLDPRSSDGLRLGLQLSPCYCTPTKAN